MLMAVANNNPPMAACWKRRVGLRLKSLRTSKSRTEMMAEVAGEPDDHIWGTLC